ncbi:MAG TPA: glycosyltransferase family 2 protein [Polyangiaceae bacterium]
MQLSVSESSRAPSAVHHPSVTVIVPTYREAQNIPLLLARIGDVRRAHDLDLDVLLMDDDSADGSVEAVAAFGEPWARIIVRKENPGLSAAVLDGLRAARKDIVVVMDADLSHPPEKIPTMLRALEADFRFVLGSRYVPGAGTDDAWGFFRWLNSRVATLLARPLTRVRDPMSGFFAMRRAELESCAPLNPVGYKIGLELIVKCGIDNVGEIPILFVDRRFGESKLTLRQQLLYLKHLRRLYIHKFGTWGHFVQFAMVGASGVAVNLAVLTALLALGVGESVSVAAAIAVSMVSNFVLNRRFTFDYARGGNIWKQFAGFCAASSIGALINYVTTISFARAYPEAPLQIGALLGVVAGLGFNFLANRFVVFRKRWIRPRQG